MGRFPAVACSRRHDTQRPRRMGTIRPTGGRPVCHRSSEPPSPSRRRRAIGPLVLCQRRRRSCGLGSKTSSRTSPGGGHDDASIIESATSGIPGQRPVATATQMKFKLSRNPPPSEDRLLILYARAKGSSAFPAACCAARIRGGRGRSKRPAPCLRGLIFTGSASGAAGCFV